MDFITIDTENDSGWLNKASKLIPKGNLICLTEEESTCYGSNPLQWFGSNLIQYLNREANTEICPLYGRHINTIDDFSYQISRSVPWGFDIANNIDAIYDVILNFITTPQNRYFIWYDSDVLFKKDRALFESIFENLIVAAHLNSKGHTIHDYKVNQRNIFLFEGINKSEIQYLIDKKYYTPQIENNSSDEESNYMKHDFVTLLIK